EVLASKLIVKVELSEFYMGFIGSKNTGLKIQFYVSNDGGENWFFVVEHKDGNLKYIKDKKKVDFKSWGSDLLVKIVLVAAEDKDSKTKLLLGGSLETPRLDAFKITYTYENQGEYSRATVATGLYNDESGSTRRLIVAPSFYYPGYEGRLIAYDATTMDYGTPAVYSLKTISETDFTASGTSYRNIVPQGTFIAWSAGDLLKSRSAASRTIYAAIPEKEHDEDDWRFDRIDFTTANQSVLKRFLKEKNNKTANLIAFVRGENRPWKLGFIDHSTPLILGPPEGDAAKMGDGYLPFKNANVGRRKVVFVGANDGMLHCFDFQTGEELWGFIPYNLLEKLKKMGKWQKGTNSFVYNSKKSEYYVDGNPMAADIYIDRDGNGTPEWTTVLICGQRRGKGKSKLTPKDFFYFALDVTDVENPQPLWEFSTKQMGETWSVPSVGKVRVGSADKWLAFVASGYKSKEDEFFAVDLQTGKVFWKFNAGKSDVKNPAIKHRKSVACSPRLVDIDLDGYADRMYIGDFFGRLWKTDLTQATWAPTAIYSDKTGLPILTRPAFWMNRAAGETTPHLYFGTGGDDSAPDDDLYSFIALVDGPTPTIEWIVGNKNDFSGLANSKVKGTLATGERVWADPVVSDEIVYFSTFVGDIENISFDTAAGEKGRLYARYVTHSNASLIGTTTLGSSAFIELASKSRQAVVMGELRTNPTQRDVLIQELDSTLQALTRGGGTAQVDDPKGSLYKLKIKSWREIIKIIRTP
ncbi:MAG: hypothetical protein FJY82_12390, partial [Candidatus Aminicenantes bacterium]|nr:hypothetical protein [Candidatus Aminicenantes bacterium]